MSSAHSGHRTEYIICVTALFRQDTRAYCTSRVVIGMSDSTPPQSCEHMGHTRSQHSSTSAVRAQGKRARRRRLRGSLGFRVRATVLPFRVRSQTGSSHILHSGQRSRNLPIRAVGGIWSFLAQPRRHRSCNTMRTRTAGRDQVPSETHFETCILYLGSDSQDLVRCCLHTTACSLWSTLATLVAQAVITNYQRDATIKTSNMPPHEQETRAQHRQHGVPF